MPDSGTSYILSPGLDQAMTIAHLIRRAHPERHLTGAVMPTEAKPFLRYPFDEIKSFSESNEADISNVIPTGSRSTDYLLRHGDIRLGSITMSREALRFYDKHWSIDAASQAGIPVPHTWYNPTDITAFPVFFKSSTEGGGQRGIAHEPKELPSDANGLIFQEYIASPGTYGVGIIATDGELNAAHVHHEVESYPNVGGSAVIIERLDDERLRRYAKLLVEHTRFSGWGLVEFKWCDVRKDYVFMELNAKFWASSEFAFRNEPLFPRLLFNAEPVGASCQRMIFMHRAIARGPRFLAKTMPAFMGGAELRFVPGMWQTELARLVVPSPVRTALRRARAK